MQVLQEHHGRPFGRQLLEELHPAVVQSLPGCKRVRALGSLEPERQGERLVPAETLQDCGGRVAFEHAEVLLEDLAERPVGDRLPVGQAATRPPGRLLRLAAEPVPELPDEAGLADARIAHDRDDVRLAGLGDPAVRGLEQVQLGLPADE